LLESVPRRERVPLAVLPPDAVLAVVVVPPGVVGVPVYRGPGPIDYVCGGCGVVLCDGVIRGMFTSLAFACRCGVINAVR
jgi:hypothetical protein